MFFATSSVSSGVMIFSYESSFLNEFAEKSCERFLPYLNIISTLGETGVD